MNEKKIIEKLNETHTLKSVTDNKLVILWFLTAMFALYTFIITPTTLFEALVLLGFCAFSMFASLVEIFKPSLSHN